MEIRTTKIQIIWSHIAIFFNLALRMYFLYNIAIYISVFILKLISLFNKKILLFLTGRKETFSKLESAISINDKTIWFHCASLGEFEQGRPIMEEIKKNYKDYKIVLTFFSPSGFEVQKNFAFADVIVYLPLDTRANANKFLSIVHPKIAVFVKYEFWPNILNELKKQKIETILISGIFRKEQTFFKRYGSWMRKSLKAFSHFFVQNEISKNLLQSIGLENITVSGDTRFDRVYEITKQDNSLDFIAKFKQNKYTLVAGSTWPKGEKYLVNYINFHASENEKFIIAPHNINEQQINELQNSITKSTTKFTDTNRDYSAQVFILNTIGILTKVYNYADVAYVGGGFGKGGLHNVLEPATFGLPLIIGPNFDKFQEAVDLVKLGSCKSVQNQKEMDFELQKLSNNVSYREKNGEISKGYILKNIGATQIILKYISNKL